MTVPFSLQEIGGLVGFSLDKGPYFSASEKAMGGQNPLPLPKGGKPLKPGKYNSLLFLIFAFAVGIADLAGLAGAKKTKSGTTLRWRRSWPAAEWCWRLPSSRIPPTPARRASRSLVIPQRAAIPSRTFRDRFVLHSYAIFLPKSENLDP